MATETLTVTLEAGDNKITGKDLVAGNEDDNQIVTIADGSFDGGTLVFEFWGKGSPTEPGAGPGGDDIFLLDLSDFEEDFDILVKSMDSGDVFKVSGFDTHTVNGTIHTFTYTGSDGNEYTVTIDAESTNGTGIVQVQCFVRGTRIKTPGGETLIEDLSVGDSVLCADGTAQPIRWIGRRALTARELANNPALRPVRFEQDAIGPNQPDAPLFLSPQHRVLLRHWRAELLFGEHEVLAPAKALVNDHSITSTAGDKEVEYFHILLDRHDVIFANGVECETLMPAELMRSAMPAEAREEILQVFPQLAADFASYGETKHLALKPFEAVALRA